MKPIFGLMMVVLGIIVGCYIGIWICFIGGIAGLFNLIKNPETVTGIAVGINVAKIVFAAISGYLSGAVLIIPGMYLLQD